MGRPQSGDGLIRQVLSGSQPRRFQASTGTVKTFETALRVILLATVLFVMGNTPALVAVGPPYVVNTTADDDDGSCDSFSNNFPLPNDDCTLREAIRETNTAPGHQTITFNIVDLFLAGDYNGSWWTIRLVGPLPPLEDPEGTTIDGLFGFGTLPTINREQPGVAADNPCGPLSFPQPKIAIDANKLAADAMTIATGSSGNTIRGLSIYDSTFHAIAAESGAGTLAEPNVIDRMFIGALPDGSDPGPLERNTGFGVQQFGEFPGYLTVTGSYVGYNGMVGIDGERDFSVLTVTENEVFENGGETDSHDGIDINGINSVVRCNLSHHNRSLTVNGGGGNGIELGSTDPASHLDNNIVEYNTVTFNTSAGISIRKGASGNLIQKNISAHNVAGITVNVEKLLDPDTLVLSGVPTNRNGIYKNSTYLNMSPTGIDLQNEFLLHDAAPWQMMPDGQNNTEETGQDHCDPDGNIPPSEDGDPTNFASNDLQNRPDLEFADLFNGQVRIRGTLDSWPNRDFLIQFFATPSDESIGLEGKRFIGEIIVTTGAPPSCQTPFETPFFTPAEPVQDGDLITATATRHTESGVNPQTPDTWWSTSEYSGSVPVNNFLPVGKVTGGGYIRPETLTACTAQCVNASDKRANFGFVAQYKNHTDGDPQGHINFVWNPGKLHFGSTDYLFMSLIVTRDDETGNGTAKWQGEGKLNNKPGYCFKANVKDEGEPGTMDSFRIKIWKKTDANCSVEPPTGIYDNGTDATETILSGGNIQIHHP